jgi:hypothetical protein
MFRVVGCFVTWIRCRFSFDSEEDDGCSRRQMQADVTWRVHANWRIQISMYSTSGLHLTRLEPL